MAVFSTLTFGYYVLVRNKCWEKETGFYKYATKYNILVELKFISKKIVNK